MSLRKKSLGKRGFSQLKLLATAGVIFVVAGIVLTFGAKITQDVAKEMTANSTSYLAAMNATKGIGKLAKYMPLLGLVVAAAIIIGVVVSSFGGSGST